MAATGAGITFSITALALAACSNSTPMLFMGDGRPTTQVQCQATDFGSCVAQARVQCGDAGFDTASDTVQDGARTLVFACRQPGGAR
jgi:hypothetical protein